MADDIKISGLNGQAGSSSQPGAAGGGQPVPGQTTGKTAGNAGGAAAGANSGGGDLNPIIDLSKATSPRRANAIMLGGEEETAQAPAKEKYAIPSLVTEKFPDLIQLIKETESMNDEERDYWFQILPIMTEEQIKKFRDILVNEKHMIEWKEFETKEKRKAITTAESASKEKEKAEEEDLLKRLSQV